MPVLNATTSTPAPTASGYTPQVDVGTEAIARPKLRELPPILLTVHPERWQVMHGMVVPLCGAIKLLRGCNNVDMLPNGKYTIADAITQAHREGAVEIPWDVDGPGTSYLREVAPGVYLTRWQTATAGSEYVQVDEVGYAKWLRGLVDAGKIPKPRAYVVERLLAVAQKDLGEIADRLATTPSLKPRAKRLEDDIKALEAERQSLTATTVAGKPAGASLVE